MGREHESLFINIEKITKTIARYPIYHLEATSETSSSEVEIPTVFSMWCMWLSTLYEHSR